MLSVDEARLKIFEADSPVRQRRGLSGIQSKDFPSDWGMLFPADKLSRRQFWMPDTHFDLDIIFMSADYYVLDIHRGLKHFPFKQPQHKIPLSKEVLSQHVLELRSDSPHAASIQPGMILQFESRVISIMMHPFIFFGEKPYRIRSHHYKGKKG